MNTKRTVTSVQLMDDCGISSRKEVLAQIDEGDRSFVLLQLADNLTQVLEYRDGAVEWISDEEEYFRKHQLFSEE